MDVSHLESPAVGPATWALISFDWSWCMHGTAAEVCYRLFAQRQFHSLAETDAREFTPWQLCGSLSGERNENQNEGKSQQEQKMRKTREPEENLAGNGGGVLRFSAHTQSLAAKSEAGGQPGTLRPGREQAANWQCGLLVKCWVSSDMIGEGRGVGRGWRRMRTRATARASPHSAAKSGLRRKKGVGGGGVLVGGLGWNEVFSFEHRATAG